MTTLDGQGGKEAFKCLCLVANAASRLQNWIVGDGYQLIRFTLTASGVPALHQPSACLAMQLAESTSDTADGKLDRGLACVAVCHLRFVQESFRWADSVSGSVSGSVKVSV